MVRPSPDPSQHERLLITPKMHSSLKLKYIQNIYISFDLKINIGVLSFHIELNDYTNNNDNIHNTSIPIVYRVPCSHQSACLSTTLGPPSVPTKI